MSATTCTWCQAEVTNGLALCERCQTTLSHACVNSASYFADVERIRPGQRVKAKSTYRSAPPPGVDPPRDPIANTLDYVSMVVFGWCRNLEDDRPVGAMPSTTVARLGWLESHRVTIATLEWAGECLRELRECERDLQRILDKADTGHYAGVCGNEIGREETDDGTVSLHCPRHLYVPAGESWVRCPECGRTWPATDRRTEMLRQARNEVAPVRVIANVVVQLTEEPSVEKLTRRIEKWVERGQLKDYGVRVLDGQPRRVYRIDDVVKLVTGELLPKDAKAC